MTQPTFPITSPATAAPALVDTLHPVKCYGYWTIEIAQAVYDKYGPDYPALGWEDHYRFIPEEIWLGWENLKVSKRFTWMCLAMRSYEKEQEELKNKPKSSYKPKAHIIAKKKEEREQRLKGYAWTSERDYRADAYEKHNLEIAELKKENLHLKAYAKEMTIAYAKKCK